MSHQCRLPASFTSLYRLFLRTASASVLHHRSARLNLITRWRPIFDAAAKVTKELEYSPQGSTSTWRQERIDWLKIWNERVDHTLALLYTSCHSRGLPHQLVRNLSYLQGSEKERMLQIQGRRKAWDPRNKALLTKIPTVKLKDLNALAKKQKEAQFESNADGALSEVIRMAEGCGNLTLGRDSTISSRDA